MHRLRPDAQVRFCQSFVKLEDLGLHALAPAARATICAIGIQTIGQNRPGDAVLRPSHDVENLELHRRQRHRSLLLNLARAKAARAGELPSGAPVHDAVSCAGSAPSVAGAGGSDGAASGPDTGGVAGSEDSAGLLNCSPTWSWSKPRRDAMRRWPLSRCARVSRSGVTSFGSTGSNSSRS